MTPSFQQSRAWWVFIRERFPPASNGMMALCFALGNMALATRLAQTPWQLRRLPVAAIVTLLFFFRLRCFDEIKDYREDLARHPDRPLARGLLTPRQVRGMITVLTAVELLLVAPLGRGPLTLYALAVGYSFLMYREFFVAHWLRPQLMLYAVSHTAVAIPLGFALAALALGGAAEGLPARGWVLGPVNWMLFNIYEFGRKTFAPAEEHAAADSYSSLYGPAGALALCLSQAAVALALLGGWVGVSPLPRATAALLLLGFALVYAARPTPAAARAYRAATGGYVIVFYVLMAAQL